MLSLPGFLYGLPNNLSGLTDTFLIRMGIHPQRYRLVGVAQGLRHAGHICPVGDGNACEGMAQFVGVQIGDTVPLRILLQIPGRALRVHRLRASLLGEHILTDCLLGLLCAQLAQQGQRVGPGIHGA